MASVGKALREKLLSAREHELLEVNVFLRGEPAQQVLAAASQELDASKRMQRIVRALQSDVMSYLEAESQHMVSARGGTTVVPAVTGAESLWINNSIACRANLHVLKKLIEHPHVLHIDLAKRASLAELLDLVHPISHPEPLTARIGRMCSRIFRSKDSPPHPTWSVTQIGAPRLWELGIQGEGVLVAVIDTGVNYNHPDLIDQMWDGGSEWPNHGRDFEHDDDDPMDEFGHGTLSAGIVAGNGRGGTATGVAPKAKIMALRTGTREKDYWKAFEFAASNGAHVISMSVNWKSTDHDVDYPGWRRACETLLAAGILHVNSAGNRGGLPSSPIPFNIGAPANCPPPHLHPAQELMGGLSSVITCGATERDGKLFPSSGHGPSAWEAVPYADYPYQTGQRMGLIKPDICAPTNTTSCSLSARGGTGYEHASGTSAAAPHVAGCLALLASACLRAGKPIVPSNIQQSLENKPAWIPGQTRDKENGYGVGRVDVYDAYQFGRTRGWW